MYALFIEGGSPGMTVLTVILLALLLAAWKAPAWVKETGMIALVVGVIWSLMGFYQAATVIEKAQGIAQHIIWGGMKVAVIPLLYGLLIYLVSLIIRIIQKPRI
jgi:amino acid transporter